MYANLCDLFKWPRTRCILDLKPHNICKWPNCFHVKILTPWYKPREIQLLQRTGSNYFVNINKTSLVFFSFGHNKPMDQNSQIMKCNNIEENAKTHMVSHVVVLFSSEHFFLSTLNSLTPASPFFYTPSLPQSSLVITCT